MLKVNKVVDDFVAVGDGFPLDSDTADVVGFGIAHHEGVPGVRAGLLLGQLDVF